MNKDNTIALGVGLVAGVLVGGIVALLYAPKSGEEIRHLIKELST